MTRSIPAVLTVLLLVFSGQSAGADAYEECKSACDSGFSACMAGITVVNDIEIQEAKSQCENESAQCNAKCENAYQKAQQGVQDEAPKERQ